MGVIAAILLVAAIMFGGWQLGWWFKVQNTKRQGQIINIQAHNFRQSYGTQQALRDQITQNIGNVLTVTSQIAEDPSDAGSLKAQRAAIMSIVCSQAAQVTGDPLTPDQASFISTNCLAGALNPASQYAVH